MALGSASAGPSHVDAGEERNALLRLQEDRDAAVKRREEVLRQAATTEGRLQLERQTALDDARLEKQEELLEQMNARAAQEKAQLEAQFLAAQETIRSMQAAQRKD